MLDSRMTATLQHGQCTENIALDIGIGIRNAVPYARLGREVNYSPEPFASKQFGNAVPVGQIEMRETKARGAPENIQPCVLQPDIIVLVEAVEPDDLVATVQQRFRRVESDKPGRTGDQYLHDRRTSGNDAGAAPGSGLAGALPGNSGTLGPGPGSAGPPGSHSAVVDRVFRS